MQLKEIIDHVNFSLATTNSDLNKNIEGLYCCDLLSWVMSHAKQGHAWITVQTHINIVAVASLLEISCIIIPEGIKIDAETIVKAEEENIAIIKTNLNSYEIFCKLHEMGLK